MRMTHNSSTEESHTQPSLVTLVASRLQLLKHCREATLRCFRSCQRLSQRRSPKTQPPVITALNNNQPKQCGFSNTFPKNVKSYDSDQCISQSPISRLITINELL